MKYTMSLTVFLAVFFNLFVVGFLLILQAVVFRKRKCGMPETKLEFDIEPICFASLSNHLSHYCTILRLI